MVPGATAEAPAGAERIGAGIGRISNLVRSKVPMDFRKSLDFQFQLISEDFRKVRRKVKKVPMASAMVLAFCSAGSNGFVRTFDPNWHLVQLNPFGISGP